MDISQPIPIKSKYVDYVWMSDSFHYIQNKYHLIMEITKMSKVNATIIFNHLHHKDQIPYQGLDYALSLSHYYKLFQVLHKKIYMFSEKEFLRHTHKNIGKNGHTVDNLLVVLSNKYLLEELKKIATNPHYHKLNYSINPGYAKSETKNELVLTINYPAGWFKDEFKSNLFKSNYTVNKSRLKNISYVQNLTNDNILVPIPHNY